MRHKEDEGRGATYAKRHSENLEFHPRRGGNRCERMKRSLAPPRRIWRRAVNTGGENRHLAVRNVISNSKAMTTGRAAAADHSLGPRTRLPAACAPPFLFLSLVLFALPSTPPSTSSTGQTRIVISAFDWWPFDGYRRGW